MAKVYDWAVNPYKEARAIKDAKDQNGGKTPSEEQVRALYEKYGGLIVEKEGASNIMGAPEDVAEITVNKESKRVKVADDTKKGKKNDDAE